MSISINDLVVKGNRVIVKLLPVRPDKTSKGLYLPNIKDVGKYDRGEIVAVGDKYNGEAKVGDKVIFSIYSALYNQDIELFDGNEYLILNNADLWAIILDETSVL